MNILTTRTLRYTDEGGDEKDLVVTIFAPVQVDALTWTCDFVLDPPIRRRVPTAEGVDFLHAFIACLHHVRVCLKSPELRGRVHWDGMEHCGLPEFEERRPAPDLDILATRALAYPNEKGGEREVLLTVFVPFKDMGDGRWKCGFMFGPPAPTPVSYGWGKDYTEALLDSLALARKAYNALVPRSLALSGDLFDCDDFPVAIGRAFQLTRPADPQKEK